MVVMEHCQASSKDSDRRPIYFVLGLFVAFLHLNLISFRFLGMEACRFSGYEWDETKSSTKGLN
jgi:hypothetical protein